MIIFSLQHALKVQFFSLSFFSFTKELSSSNWNQTIKPILVRDAIVVEHRGHLGGRRELEGGRGRRGGGRGVRRGRRHGGHARRRAPGLPVGLDVLDACHVDLEEGGEKKREQGLVEKSVLD